MKIGYLAPIQDGTGFAHAANSTILGMDAAGIDVVPIEVKLAGQVIKPNKKILDLVSKSMGGITTVVQHVLPPLMSYKHGVKNIGYAHFETTNFRSSNWQQYINIMDELWVCCKENNNSALNSGVRIPVKTVPIPHDLDIYKSNIDPIPDLPINNKFVFYTISDYSSRKNVQGVIAAYLSEFNRSDDVLLILKCYLEGHNFKQSKQIIANDIQQIKESLRKHSDHNKYPQILIISEYLDDDSIYRLHKSCDCFVSAERGAAWNIPAFDAMGFGNAVIVTDWGGQTQFVKGAYTWRIPCTMSMVQGMTLCPYPNLYTCKELWADPDIEILKRSMRESRDTLPSADKSSVSSDRICRELSPFSLLNAGNTIKDLL